MQPVLSILREVRDPRAPNARHELSAILFIALAATLCGQKSCVHIADFGAVNAAELAEIVDLPHGAPSHATVRGSFCVGSIVYLGGHAGYRARCDGSARGSLVRSLYVFWMRPHRS